MKNIKSIFPCLFMLFFVSCKKDRPATSSPLPVKSDKKEITLFQFKQTDNKLVLEGDINGRINASGDTIKVSVPATTNITNLVAAISISGQSILPASSSAQNFDSPVKYTVTAEDGSTRSYIVMVSFTGTIFIGDLNGIMRAIDKNNGGIIWSKKLCSFIESSATVSDGTVYVTGDDGLYALYAATGNIKWKQPVTHEGFTNNYLHGTPLYANGTVYATFWNGNIYACDATTGSLKWKVTTPNNKFYGSPALANTTLYAAGTDSWLYALDISNGAMKWKFKGAGPFYSNPAIDNGIVYIGSLGLPHTYAINANTGEVLWDQGYYAAFTSPTIYNNTLYFMDDNDLFAVDPTSGNFKFTGTGNNNGNIRYSDRPSVYLANNVGYVSSLDKSVYAFDASHGTRLWSFATGGSIWASPVAVGETLFFGGGEGIFYALDAANGKKKWMLNFLVGIWSSACIVDTDGKVYHPTVSGEKN